MKTRLSAAAIAALCAALLLCSIEAEGKPFIPLLVESDGAELAQCKTKQFLPV